MENSAAREGFHADLTSLRFEQFFGDRQSQSGAL
jgi:hypothetical protein